MISRALSVACWVFWAAIFVAAMRVGWYFVTAL
jgi:hypothetical protein